ncbi:MAG: penicillin-binding protein [Actinomycetota bacterium]|jgi:penicillin-binding protein 1A|nr:penicillin-binding protein [Actinomycetota bacterium]
MAQAGRKVRPTPAPGRIRALAACLAGAVLLAACSLPAVNLEKEKALALRSTVYAADGTRLARLYRQNRVLVSLQQMPRTLIDAVLAAEDARFYEHGGFDLRAIARAAIVNLKRGEVTQGGSTITQQYVKNTYFRDPGRTLERKARELRLAIEVERRYSKDEILERYLNAVYLGAGAYGVKAAAETYFRKGLGDLTLPESALLASLIKGPSYYDPTEHPKRALARRNFVLKRMLDLDKISSTTERNALQSPLGVRSRPPRIKTREPYFVEAVKQEVLAHPSLGSNDIERAKALWQGGLKIETTLVPKMQRAAEAAVADILDEPGDPSAALVAIRPRTGRIVAMVGGKDWSRSQVNLALGREGGGSGRQAGSTFKAIDAAAAMEQGVTLETKFESSPAVFTATDGSTWVVRNAEGGGSGRVSLYEGLVHSINGVYARLGLELGAGSIATQAHLMGVRAELPPHPSIALGSADVSVLDMAAAYSTLANGGTAVEPTTIRAIELPDGEVFHAEQERTPSVVSRGNAYLLTEALQDVIARGTGVAADIGRPAAGKTGTTNNYSDAWFVGYTPQLVAAVWVGYPEGLVPMTNVHGIRVFGGTFPALIWRQFMMEALAGTPVKAFEIPKGELVTVLIDPESGLLAAPWCEGKKRTMLRQLVPRDYCPQPPPPKPSPTATPSPEPSPSGSRGAKPSPSASPEGKPSPTPSPRGSPSPSPHRTKKAKKP